MEQTIRRELIVDELYLKVGDKITSDMLTHIKNLQHDYDTTRGLWCIDASPRSKTYDWICIHAFQLTGREKIDTEFDWNAKGFWARADNVLEAVYWVSKLNEWNWALSGYFPEAHVKIDFIRIYSKQSIQYQMKLCDPPDWAHYVDEDYIPRIDTEIK